MTSPVQSVYENAGIYEWSDAIHGWVLVRDHYDPFFEHENLDVDDEYIPPSAWSGGAGGDGSVVVQASGSGSTDR
jgi:hypothetical protein